VLGCIDEDPEGAQIQPGLHTTVFQAEIYTFMTCGMDNVGNGYTRRNIYITNSQAAIMALDSFQINSKLVWNCHQSLVKMATHNMIQLVWVPLHMEIDGNETAHHILISTSIT
jgi:hypothetical protein